MDRRWGFGTEQRLRDDNQDTYGVFVYRDFVLAIVCDGMGGHHGGAHASALAVRTIYDALHELQGVMPVREALIEAVKRANQAIYDASRRSHRLMGMGTTVAAVALTDDTAHVVHVGDSRVYLVRGGEAHQLTRDHTMVNLFVEAELLSPEDAASHPEAHVLSRSLGVERQVEVEAHEPIPLEYADTFVVCTDGVHGVVTEWEFGKTDWADPQEGVWEALRLVAAREGDDNATIVATIVGEFEGVGRPPTPPPTVEDVEDPLSPVSDNVPAPPPPQPTATPSIAPPALAMPQPMVNSPTLVDIPATPAPAPPKEVTPQTKGAQAAGPAQGAQAAAPAQAPAKPKEKKKKAKAPANNGGAGRIALAGGAVALVSALALGSALFAWKKLGHHGPPAQVVEATVAQADPSAMLGQTDPAVTTAPAAKVPMLFAPELPPEPKRVGHHARKYNAPPPGGSDQYTAVQAARTNNCELALTTIQSAMLKSADYASLYYQAWTCFNETDQQKLLDAKVTDPKDFTPLLVHFEGTLREDDPKTPLWARPPAGGIEARLGAFAESGDRDLFSDVMLDYYGEDGVADQLGRDVYLEAVAAAGLGRLELDPKDPLVDEWARRVHWVSRSMQGPVGALLASYRPDLVPIVNQLMIEATKGADPAHLLDKEPPSTIPEVVRQAWAAGLGLTETPKSRPTTEALAAGVKSTEPSTPATATGTKASTGTKPKTPKTTKPKPAPTPTETEEPLPAPKIYRPPR